MLGNSFTDFVTSENDTSSESCQIGPNVCKPLSHPDGRDIQNGCAVSANDGEIYLMGGTLYEDVYLYDTKADTYTLKPDMKRASPLHQPWHISCTAIKNQEGENVSFL